MADNEQRRALANTVPTTEVIRDAVTFPRDRLGEPLDISGERFDAWLDQVRRHAAERAALEATHRAERAELDRDEWQAYVIDAYRDRDKARRERDMAAHMRKEMRAERDRAMARSDAKAAQTAYWQGLVDAVRELHQHGGAMSDEALENHTPVCASCLEEWPCPTIEALDGAP